MTKLRDWSEKHFGFVLMAPATIYLAAVALYVTVFLVYYSLCNWSVSSPQPSFIGLVNYAQILKDSKFWESIVLTVVFLITAVGVEVILGFAIALLLNQQIYGVKIIRTLLILPMAMTPVVSGLIWRILYDPTLGLINYLLSFIGIKGPAWVATAGTALPAVILVDIWQWTPFAFLVITAGLQSLPAEPYEAASIDGAGPFQVLFRITIPLLKQVLLILILLRGIDVIKVFDTIYVITNGGPGTATQTLVFYTFLKGFQWFDLGYASAMAMFLLFAVTILVQFFVKRTGVNLADVN
ncbi:MAG: carbohydrate ABC transporter permease [Bacillota bacterium]